jgi:tryptophan-rich sensory protein
MVKLVKLLVSLAASSAAGAIGSIATITNIPTWYAALEKPFFNPPNWVFGPVWTTLYVLMGISLYLAWTTSYKKPKKWAYSAFGVQLVLNTLWSLVFFGLHQPWAAVVIIALLLVSIVMTIKLFWPISKPAAYLLVPYLAWVMFASVLNTAVALLN